MNNEVNIYDKISEELGIFANVSGILAKLKKDNHFELLDKCFNKIITNELSFARRGYFRRTIQD